MTVPIATMQAMSKIASEGGSTPEAAQPNPFASGMWPWNLMQGAADASKAAQAAPAPAPAPAKSSRSKDK